MQIFLFFALIISVLAVIFAVQNNDPTTVSFAIWKFNGSLALILLVAVAAGSLISFFVSLPTNLKTRWTLRQQRKKMTELESSLASVRGQLEEAQKIISEANKPAPPPAALPEPVKPAAGEPELEPEPEPEKNSSVEA
jgi:lipopolysaccharide assembly protein A